MAGHEGGPFEDQATLERARAILARGYARQLASRRSEETTDENGATA